MGKVLQMANQKAGKVNVVEQMRKLINKKSGMNVAHD